VGKVEPGTPPTAEPVPVILFLCVHNAGRSQMAAAFARHLAGPRADVLSAGSAPGTVVNPVAVEAMAEVGLDISSAQPRRWGPDELDRVDVVITMGCGDECPVVPGTRYLDWPLTDPAGEGLDVVRPVRDDIERHVRALLDDLSVAVSR
jgi:arsenate reductase